MGTFRNFFRMSRSEFDYILAHIHHDIAKAATNTVPISAEQRLMVRIDFSTSSIIANCLWNLHHCTAECRHILYQLISINVPGNIKVPSYRPVNDIATL